MCNLMLLLGSLQKRIELWHIPNGIKPLIIGYSGIAEVPTRNHTLEKRQCPVWLIHMR